MKTRLLLTFSAIAMLGMLTGCPPSYPNCNDDEDCNVEGHTGVCVNGLCQECAVDSDCKEGFACESNKCVPAAECQSNADCPGGQVCQNGECVACTADDQCGPDAVCRAGACQPKAECSTDDDCGEGMSCVDGSCVAARPPCETQPIRFGFNEANLTSEARDALQGLAECLRTTAPNASVTIEGHADERGTEDYNLALGERRASSVKKYLVNLGIDGNRLRTVSYGEERPVSTGSDEASWAENRRAAFVTTR